MKFHFPKIWQRFYIWIVQKAIIKHNNISSNNRHGIYSIRCYGNIIHENNFINNPIDAYFFTLGIRSNHWRRNFWDDWDGLGGYKIKGETMIFSFKEPFINYVDWYNYDLFPAKEPYDIENLDVKTFIYP